MSTHDSRDFRPETLAISVGYDPKAGRGAAKPPLYATSTFVYESAQHAKDVHEVFFDGPQTEAARRIGTEGLPFIYARLGHPNLDMLEQRMAALDDADLAAGFNSGMAAISTTLMTFVRPGDSVLYSQPIYSGTDNLLNTVFPAFNVTPFGIAVGIDESVIRAAAELAMDHGRLSVIMLESPANPTAAIVDIALIARIADDIAARQGERPIIVVDNTFLGPLQQSPLKFGADLCITSLTKYCAGHSDLLAGNLSGSAPLVEAVKGRRTIVGSHMDPHTAWVVLRSLETLAVRTERACRNAIQIADFLRAHPKVEEITFLGHTDPDSPKGAVYARQCRGTGSTFSMRIHGGEAECFRFLDALKLLKMAVSLGGTETLICHSGTTTHYAVPRARRLASGITDGSMRLSVGIEHPDDLIEDLAQALEAI